MYTQINGITYINGQNGPYDNKVNNSSVRYGRNSAANHIDYLKERDIKTDVKFPDTSNLLSLDSDTFERKMQQIEEASEAIDIIDEFIAPRKFVQRYMPQGEKGTVDTEALMGAAYEEMGKRTSVSVEELNKNYEMLTAGDSFVEENPEFKPITDAYDLDGNGRIDVAEYSTSILAEDALSTDDNDFDAANINGIVSSKGQKAATLLNAKFNYEIANRMYQSLYDSYNLGDAQEKFLQNKNNLVK